MPLLLRPPSTVAGAAGPRRALGSGRAPRLVSMSAAAPKGFGGGGGAPNKHQPSSSAASPRSPTRPSPPTTAAAASKGFGSGPPKQQQQQQQQPPAKKADAGAAAAGPGEGRLQTQEVQRAATLLLTALVAETDPARRAAIARDNVEQIDGVFFAVADAYVKIARQEAKGDEVAAGLETAVRCALDAKQATLRPEIRLLNRLLDAPSLEARRSVLAEGGGADMLRDRSSREYLNRLLSRFEQDVAAQTKNAARSGAAADGGPLGALKRAIEETRAIVAAAAAVSGASGGGGDK